MQQKNALIEGKIGKTLFYFALPFLGASLLQALYGAVDLYVVGRFENSAAVSAVSIGSQVMHTLTGIIMGVATGGTVLIGRYIGGKEEKKAALTVGNITLLFLALAVVVTPLLVLAVRPIVNVMQTPVEAVEDAVDYLKICGYGVPFIVGYNAISGIFRGFGDSKTPLLFVIIACIVNIICDFLFVGSFGMGAAGAALATILAQAVSFLAALAYLYRKGLPVPFSRKDIVPDRTIITKILAVGLPIAVQDALVNVSFLVITVIMNTLGLVASAAVGVAERLLSFAFLVPSSFAQAVAAMVAQNIGAGRKDRGWSTLKYGVGFSLIFGIAAFALSNLFPELLSSIFSKDAEVIRASGQYIRSYSIDCMLVSFIFCVNSYFSSYGKAMYSFVHSMIATFAVRIPLTYLFSKIASDSLYVIGFAAPAATVVSIIICAGILIFSKNLRPEVR